MTLIMTYPQSLFVYCEKLSVCCVTLWIVGNSHICVWSHLIHI